MFLGDLTIELNDLHTNGYNHNGEIYPFEVENFILDAPARSLVKCCVSHGGYGACEKCTVRGVYAEDRMNYALVGPEVQPRTDQSFANQEDRVHHCGHSPLQMVNGIGLVSSFRLDTMHLLYKGAFSRLLDVLFTWEGPWNFTAENILAVTEKLLGFVVSCPGDFNRKPRKIEEYYKYKATELRRFLLYDGVVAFKNQMQDNIYNLFCLLHCAIYILASQHLLPNFIDQAELFLKHFVQYSAQVFGNHFVVYNVHSLTHLVDECRMHGVVENFSAFCYENHLKTIKETLRSGYLPLEQIVKRDSERGNNRQVKLKSNDNSVQLFKQHIDPLEQENGHQYQKILVNSVVFKLGEKNGCFITTDRRVAILKNIICRNENSVLFIGNCFANTEDLYNYPLNSSQLGIFKVGGLSLVREAFPLENILGKCWLLKDGDSLVSIPLVHSTPLLH
ncbi:uncharacterized protein LOC127751133 [Frankliniella occidentalis]|uniref:Uncharacterized protein LOC127751133 n=1 Tax=Frankliniella occidentalis TaxID=133901 RepID=A0A9C6XT23_FRAOC|nr:uncharacterized protein LOC127751133 [Frankliniella occidentalis]